MTATITMSNYIFNTKTNVYSKLVYAAIKKYSNSKGTCFPSRNTLARLCNISLSTLRKAINSLVDASILDKKYRYRENRSQTSNMYTLMPFMTSGDYYFKVRADIFELELTEIETVVYMYLCSCANKDSECYPSISQISAACGVSQTSVKSAIKGLCESGLILKINQFRKDGGKRNNMYKLITEEINPVKIDEFKQINEDEAADHDNDVKFHEVNEEANTVVEKHEAIKSEYCDLLDDNEVKEVDKQSVHQKETKENTDTKIRGDIFNFKLSKHALMVYLYVKTYSKLNRGKNSSKYEIAHNCKISISETEKALREIKNAKLIEDLGHKELSSDPIVITEPPPWSI
ncbi:helix-turn-helix domain-containing protein [Sedimentibacter sp. MB35-C1]|uniref:helix-turn-helix domain-containing protein n=1 Tax=Sedimentibacter sp. MB35-C1 TaxID=3070995 RepID=UPI0027E1BC20|nr:helix-turn-helix domain-containing protein [Sedimentibacter sp. MB35-C1]WMJ77844.1 helix-turn-helix domain-containing protein [Sedimentibacter sp. MB35-C1]